MQTAYVQYVRSELPGTVKWFHKGGLRTDRMDQYHYQWVLYEEANVVIINLGGGVGGGVGGMISFVEVTK